MKTWMPWFKALVRCWLWNYLVIYVLCHIYPGVPHQCAALFSLGLLMKLLSFSLELYRYIIVFSCMIVICTLARFINQQLSPAVWISSLHLLAIMLTDVTRYIARSRLLDAQYFQNGLILPFLPVWFHAQKNCWVLSCWHFHVEKL